MPYSGRCRYSDRALASSTVPRNISDIAADPNRPVHKMTLKITTVDALIHQDTTTVSCNCTIHIVFVSLFRFKGSHIADSGMYYPADISL